MKERTEVNPAQNLALALCGTNFRNQVYFGKEAWPVFMILGVLCTAASLFTDNQAVGAATAITGAAFLWSIRELFEQEERVKKGWWPENPAKNRCIRKRVKESADKVK